MTTLRPLADVLLDLVDLAKDIVSHPHTTYGRRAEVKAINEEITAWVAKPSDARIADDELLMMVTALAHATDSNLTKQQVQKWCDVAEALLPFVQRAAMAAVEEMQKVPA